MNIFDDYIKVLTSRFIANGPDFRVPSEYEFNKACDGLRSQFQAELDREGYYIDAGFICRKKV